MPGRWLGFSALVLSACWRGSEPPPSPSPAPATAQHEDPLACAPVLTRAIDITIAEGKRVPPNSTAEIRSAVIQSCEQTRWSREVLSCFAKGQTEDDMDACSKQLTKQQEEDVERRIEAIMDRDQDPDPTQPSAPP